MYFINDIHAEFPEDPLIYTFSFNSFHMIRLHINQHELNDYDNIFLNTSYKIQKAMIEFHNEKECDEHYYKKLPKTMSDYKKILIFANKNRDIIIQNPSFKKVWVTCLKLQEIYAKKYSEIVYTLLLCIKQLPLDIIIFEILEILGIHIPYGCKIL